MRVDRYTDLAAFWNDSREFLERDEMGNTQLLALGSRYASDPGPNPPIAYMVVTADRPVVREGDSTNPTANGIYRRVGFRQVGEHLHLRRANS